MVVKCQNGWLGLQCYPGGAFGDYWFSLCVQCGLEREILETNWFKGLLI